MSAYITKKFHDTKLSVLDLAPVIEGSEPAESFKNSVELVQLAEKLGFNRYWLAEHHNMSGIASSATSVIIGHLAGATKHIRVGAGGIMLPNHAPLVIAEQFGTLESMYPNRIDLGLGRAPGSDQATAFALRRTLGSSGDDFPEQLYELQGYFDYNPTAKVRAVPGEGLDIPIWLLGSSGFSAQLAAQEGLPFSFASHFAPTHTLAALALYHRNFKPSKVLKEPYAMLSVNVIIADTDERAQWLATSQQLQFLSLMRGTPGKLKQPIDNIDEVWSPQEKASVGKTLSPWATLVGSPETVKGKLESFINDTKANEVIVNTAVYNQADRLRSYELLAELMA